MLVDTKLIKEYHGKKPCVLYRIEKFENGKWLGPFRDPYNMIIQPAHIMPEPEEEGLDIGIGSALICGCRYPGQLIQWFGRFEINKLFDLGFVLAKYEVTKASHANMQSVFRPDDAERTEVEHSEAKKLMLNDYRDNETIFKLSDRWLEKYRGRRLSFG